MSRRRRVGVVGTFVWDTIHGRGSRRAPVEEWGGIAYSLGAMDAALGDDWEIVPLVRVGSDLIQRARGYMSQLRRLAPDAMLIEVPHPTIRVELRYTSSERRTERLVGGLPPWSWLALRPLLRDLDALYINFISGNELELETAQLLRQNFVGPIYSDLHSLLLFAGADGVRHGRMLPDFPAWSRCFDLLQVNEAEMSLLGADPMEVAATAFTGGVSCLVVTLGQRGVAWFLAPGWNDLSTLARGTLAPAGGAIRTALVPAAVANTSGESGDPTGCGDVWGATYFSRLLAGDSFAQAMNAAGVAAARNVEHRGAGGLASFLRGEIAIP